MRLKQVWVTTKARKTSMLIDVLFRATPEALIRQVRGGLHETDAPRFFSSPPAAVRDARRRLRTAGSPHWRDKWSRKDGAL